MLETQKPPSAAELDALTEAFRRDPGRAFAQLGWAYLALGRPEEAIDVGAEGLRVNPASSNGRLMVAQAFASLHQWPEAQAELLKVVKADRNNGQGFRMLGEVLMRRTDYERAIPVLQHAQNLSPADPNVNALLRAARAGDPLGPPPPLPTPQRATGAVNTRRPSKDKASTSRSTVHPRTTGVRPRLVSNQKPVGAAQVSLRMSASVGERHLRDLLAGGLVDVPNVRSPQMSYDVPAESKWRRSIFRALLPFLVVVLLSAAAGFTWIWYTEKTKEKAVDGLLAKAQTSVVDGASTLLMAGRESALGALKIGDSENPEAKAVIARNTALLGLLYGDFDIEEISSLLSAPRDETYEREWLIADASLALDKQLHGQENQLDEVQKRVKAWLQKHKESYLLHWLDGRMLESEGKYSEARQAYLASVGTADGKNGSALGSVSLGFAALENGEYERASDYFDNALLKSEKHPLALMGQVFSMLDRASGADEVARILNVELAGLDGVEVAAQRSLGLARKEYIAQSFPNVAGLLKEAENAFHVTARARVGLLYLDMGSYEDAARIRNSIGSGLGKIPMVRQLDARMLWWQGQSEKALARIGRSESVQGLLTRGMCLFDQNKFSEARKVLKRASLLAPESLWVGLWFESARLASAKNESETEQAESALGPLGGNALEKSARLPHGLALLAQNSLSGARRKLQYTLDDVSEDYPNPVMHRSQAALAQVLLLEGKVREAKKLALKALDRVPGFSLAEGVLCQVKAIEGASDAEAVCRRLAKSGIGGAGVHVALAQIYAGRDGRSSVAARKELRLAQRKGAPTVMLQKAIATVDKSLFESLNVPKPRK